MGGNGAVPPLSLGGDRTTLVFFCAVTNIIVNAVNRITSRNPRGIQGFVCTSLMKSEMILCCSSSGVGDGLATTSVSVGLGGGEVGVVGSEVEVAVGVGFVMVDVGVMTRAVVGVVDDVKTAVSVSVVVGVVDAVSVIPTCIGLINGGDAEYWLRYVVFMMVSPLPCTGDIGAAMTTTSSMPILKTSTVITRRRGLNCILSSHHTIKTFIKHRSKSKSKVLRLYYSAKEMIYKICQKHTIIFQIVSRHKRRQLRLYSKTVEFRRWMSYGFATFGTEKATRFYFTSTMWAEVRFVCWCKYGTAFAAEPRILLLRRPTFRAYVLGTFLDRVVLIIQTTW